MAAFSFAALSMVGLPPLAGFFSKWYLVLGTIKNSSWIFLGVILLSSLLNAVYFFRVLEKVYLRSTTEKQNDKNSTENQKRDEVTPSLLIPTLVLGCGLLLLGILNAFIVKGIIEKIIPMIM